MDYDIYITNSLKIVLGYLMHFPFLQNFRVLEIMQKDSEKDPNDVSTALLAKILVNQVS